MQSVSTFFKVEKDVFYKLGERKNVEKGVGKTCHAIIETFMEIHAGLDKQK